MTARWSGPDAPESEAAAFIDTSTPEGRRERDDARYGLTADPRTPVVDVEQLRQRAERAERRLAAARTAIEALGQDPVVREPPADGCVHLDDVLAAFDRGAS